MDTRTKRKLKQAIAWINRSRPFGQRLSEEHAATLYRGVLALFDNAINEARVFFPTIDNSAFKVGKGKPRPLGASADVVLRLAAMIIHRRDQNRPWTEHGGLSLIGFDADKLSMEFSASGLSHEVLNRLHRAGKEIDLLSAVINAYASEKIPLGTLGPDYRVAICRSDGKLVAACVKQR